MTAERGERRVWTNSTPLLQVKGLHIFREQGEGRGFWGAEFFQLPHWDGKRSKGPAFRGLPFLVPFCRTERLSGRLRTGTRTQTLDRPHYIHSLSLDRFRDAAGREGWGWSGSQATVTDSLHWRPVGGLGCQVHSFNVPFLTISCLSPILTH